MGEAYLHETPWSVSGLCITVRPEDLAKLEELLNQRPGLEVHARDPETGKLVVVQECATIAEHRRRLEEIQAIPGVLTADLVMHYQPESESATTESGGAR